MPYFLNLINITAIFAMLLVYFFNNIFKPKNKQTNQKKINHEISTYLYIAILASLINIMNSISLGDAVFWYGVSLSFGIKSSIFLVIVAGFLILISIVFFNSNSQDDLSKTEDLLKTLQENVASIRYKQSEQDNIIKDHKKRFEQIATPEEVDQKIREMVDDKLDNINSDMQHISDKMAVIAEQMTQIKKVTGISNNLPSISNEDDDDDDFKTSYRKLSDDDDE